MLYLKLEMKAWKNFAQVLEDETRALHALACLQVLPLNLPRETWAFVLELVPGIEVLDREDLYFWAERSEHQRSMMH